MDRYEGDKRSIIANLVKKTQTLQFEIRSKNSTVSVEDGIGKCSLSGRNTLVIEMDQRDLGGTINRIKSLEVLSTYNCTLASKSYSLTNGMVEVEIETSEDLVEFTNEVLVEVRLIYRLK